MLSNIMDASALPYQAGRFPDPPGSTYAVTFDDVEATGPDGYNLILWHDCTVELYEPAPDDAAEAAMEAALNARGIPWTKQARYWLKDIKRYQVIYEFAFTEKRRD